VCARAAHTHAQVLRSACDWSAGMNMTEDSIHQAYMHMIKNAQHYIYIENQFFVSLINHPDVRNEVCTALCDRIVRANE
jgi:phospholipase D1/2